MLDIATVSHFERFVNSLEVNPGRFWEGVYLEEKNHRYRLNHITKLFEQVVKNEPNADTTKIRELVCKIRNLEQQSLNKASSTSLFHKAAMAIREYAGSFFYNREEVLNQIEFPEHIVATSKSSYRLMLLNGQQGTLACRVRGECAATAPRLSRHWVFEGATRSILRMINLKTARGTAPGAKMMGPCDYFGNVEAPHNHSYTIDIDKDGVPAFLINRKAPHDSRPVDTSVYTIKPEEVSSTIKATWYKGTNPSIETIKSTYTHPDRSVFGQSLFPSAGILEIDGEEALTLRKFDATKIDLTPFKARLVANNVPFKITSDPVASSDDYRAVTYLYEPNYAEDQVKNGGGLFLETHQFAQTMTPIDTSSGGFVTLGRWIDDERTQLELIAVQIPFGYTLLVDKECIHGDTNLTGMFMMCMTSNHITMNTADTVFLKSKKTHHNFSIVVAEDAPSIVVPLQPPLFLPKLSNQEDREKFHEATRRHNTVFNPFVKGTA